MIGLKCAFIRYKLQIGIYFFSYMRTLHKYSFSLFANNTHSPALFLYLFLTVELIFFHFWINIHTYQKNAPPRTQNGLLNDDNPKQGLVGGCPAPLNPRYLHEAFSVQLSHQSDYKLISWLHVNIATVIF